MGRTTRRKIHESNLSTAETDRAESVDTKGPEPVNDMSFEPNNEMKSNKRVTRKKENVESLPSAPQNSSQFDDTVKPEIKEVPKLEASKNSKRKMLTADASLEVDIEPKPTKRLTRRKEIIESVTCASPSTSQMNDIKLEIKELTESEVIKNSKRKRKAVDQSLEVDIDPKPTKRVIRQKDMIEPKQDESHKNVAEESEINISNKQHC